MPDTPPQCDPNCQKILLDADSLEAMSTVLCNHVQQYKADGGRYRDPEKVIHALIVAERAVYAAITVTLAQQGYSGDLPF